jgi:hypothetical protein
MTLNTWPPVHSIVVLAVGVIWMTGALPAFAQLPDDPTEVRPLLVGSEAPDARLTTADGGATTLHAVLGDAPAIVVFYRGGW